MPDRLASLDKLTTVLQQLGLQQPGGTSPSEVARVQTDLLLARMASLTDTLRVAEWNDTSRAAARLLLADLAMVAAQVRGHATATGGRLATTIDDVRTALARSSNGRPGTIA